MAETRHVATEGMELLLGDRQVKRAQEIGEPDLVDKIADESVATTSDELLAFFTKVDHPALKMDPLI